MAKRKAIPQFESLRITLKDPILHNAEIHFTYKHKIYHMTLEGFNKFLHEHDGISPDDLHQSTCVGVVYASDGRKIHVAFDFKLMLKAAMEGEE